MPDGRLLLVGHEPDLSNLARELTGGRIDLKKGGLAVVRLDGAASGELAVLVRPRELALIAGVPARRGVTRAPRRSRRRAIRPRIDSRSRSACGCSASAGEAFSSFWRSLRTNTSTERSPRTIV